MRNYRNGTEVYLWWSFSGWAGCTSGLLYTAPAVHQTEWPLPQTRVESIFYKTPNRDYPITFLVGSWNGIWIRELTTSTFNIVSN